MRKGLFINGSDVLMDQIHQLFDEVGDGSIVRDNLEQFLRKPGMFSLDFTDLAKIQLPGGGSLLIGEEWARQWDRKIAATEASLQALRLIKQQLKTVKFTDPRDGRIEKLDLEDLAYALVHHNRREWGRVANQVVQANNAALANGGKVTSCFCTRHGELLAIVTKANGTVPRASFLH